jgi:arylformamidase
MSDSEFYGREYNNRVLFPGHPEVMARWADKSARTRSSMICYLDRQYGEGPGETLDIFPARKGDGTCMMFIHGGFWRAMDKQDFSFLAPAWVDAGVSIVAVNYDLCPKVSIEEIVKQMLRASGWLWNHAEDYGMDQDRLYIAGHSAGGHLAAMMMAAIWPVYDKALPRDLYKGGLAVSGVYDLRPIAQVGWLNPDLKLDEASALKVSPAFLPPATRGPLVTSVGGRESSEFKRQNALLGARWKSAVTADIPVPDADHFTILDELCNQSGPLFTGTRKMMKLDK